MGTTKTNTIAKIIQPFIYLGCVALLFWSCRQSVSETAYIPIEPLFLHANGEGFAGSESCAKCHSEIYKTHLETAHFNTSKIADTTTITGNLTAGKNTFTVNDLIEFILIATDSGIYEEVRRIKDDHLFSKSKIDIVIGSGTKGQSYLSWNEGQLNQLQSSYFAPTDSWVNSPNYPEHLIPNRPVMPRCLECHVTYAKNTPSFSAKNVYDTQQLLLGINCESCHGPSANHVGFHTGNPEISEAKYVTKFSDLSQQQRLDACALCHSGPRLPKKQPFSFSLGDTLKNYSTADYKEIDKLNLDVHSNQLGLLTSSACFKKSDAMDCSTCHDVHIKQRGNTDHFNQKCMECHSENTMVCAEDSAMLASNNNNCITCHMPLLTTKAIKIRNESDNVPVQVRTHLIDIYLETL